MTEEQPKVHALTLQRVYMPEETVGILVAGGRYFTTIELPWRENEPYVSCIPEGSFRWAKYNSPKHGQCILLRGVTGRDMIEIHIANNTGDLLGCIGVGSGFSQWGITESAKALAGLLHISADFGTIDVKGQCQCAR